ncbi:MAG: hypothetical protein ACYDEV_14695 [Acidiferrobacter sp.]
MPLELGGLMSVNYPGLKAGACKDAIQAQKTWVGHNHSWLRYTEVAHGRYRATRTHRRMLTLSLPLCQVGIMLAKGKAPKVPAALARGEPLCDIPEGS